MSPSTSSRWSPTSEQLMILEEMYRGGVRTPNAVQIQQITTHLSMYGKIEGKNVFYWFQNHKARDRQRLRRKLLSAASRQHQPPPPHHHNHHQQQNQCHQQPPQPHQHYLLGCNGCTPPPLPTCVGGVFEYHNYPCYDQTNEDLTKSTMMRLSGRDWMAAMVDVGPTTSPALCHRPLKTLELFPLTTSTDRPKKY